MPIQVRATSSSFFFNVDIFDMIKKFGISELADLLFDDSVMLTYMNTFDTGFESSYIDSNEVDYLEGYFSSQPT
jgi:hypothetical protein